MSRTRTTELTVLSALVAACLGLLLVAPGRAKASQPDPFFGVMSQLPLSQKDFDTMAWGRVGSYRVSITWGSIDHDGSGNSNFESLDRLVESVSRRGITLLPAIHNTPPWLAGDRRRLPIWNPYVIGRWKGFLRELVDRYGEEGTFWLDHPDVPERPIRNWQIWNEPNIRYWAWPVSPKRYAKLLRISAAAIREGDPSARIVTAGFYARPPNGTGMVAWKYLRNLYRQPGFRKSFDIAAIHPYAATTSLSVRRTFPIRRELNRHRQRGKPIMVTEIGWGSDATSSFGKGSFDAQGAQLGSAFRAYMKHRQRLKLRAVYWFSWEDLPLGSKSCSFCMETGLFDRHGDAKPAWYRLLDITHGI